MNKLKCWSLIFQIFLFSSNSISQFMQNGGFETTNNLFSGIAIDRANYWHTIYNSPDLYHNQVTSSTDQHSGNGCAGFGLVTNTNAEYFYGTTLNLAANTQYILSFYIKNFSPNNTISVGVKITNTQPSPTYNQSTVLTPVNAVSNFLSNPNNQPDFIFKPIGNLYTKVSFCFIPEFSGVHYVIFGNFTNNSPNISNYFFLDDVDIKLATTEQQNLTTNIELISTSLCVNSPIIFNGSNSQNETSYSWEISQSNNSTPIYIGDIQNGSAGLFDINSIFNSLNFLPNPGDCFKVKLNIYNECTSSDEIEFCYEDVSLTFDNPPELLCEGDPFVLNVNGLSNWIYSWNTGESGLGLNSLVVTPSFPTSEYNVTITTPTGCTSSQSVLFNVLSGNNTPPLLNGINNTGDYIAYVKAGDEICFNISSFDSPNETVVMTWNNGIPNAIFSTQGSLFMNGEFCWDTDNVTEGSYFFDVTLTDNNLCDQPLSSTYTFQINVVCENCHICVTLDGNSNSNSTPPAFIDAASCILAGLNGNYFVGIGNSILFQAGNYIELGPAFDTQDGFFEAVIDPVTCLTGCSNCCDNFSGFTIDYPLTNVFTPNYDGINDIFFFRDNDNPTCAFNATKFEFYVINRTGATVYHLEDENFNSQTCCPFIAPNDNTPSSIFWDGIINVGFGTGQMAPNDTYFWTLKLSNCDHSELLSDFMDLVLQSNMNVQDNLIEEQNYIEDNLCLGNLVQVSNFQKTKLVVYPNPATEKLFVFANKKIKKIMIYDLNGQLILNKMNFFEQGINVSLFLSGEYRIEIEFVDNTLENKSFVKI